MKVNEQYREVKKWFESAVTYEGEPYVVDLEQAAAIADPHKNTIVVARAGSGKTRTIVAKIVYLVAKCGVKPDAIMAFVFNNNAAREINLRLSKMMVDGRPVMEGARVAQTFHAFARRLVYDICGGKEKCGKILVADREDFAFAVIYQVLKDVKNLEKLRRLVHGDDKKAQLTTEEKRHFARMMVMFINRAQQKYLGEEEKMRAEVEARLHDDSTPEREKVFLELGLECYTRYHQCLLNPKMRQTLRLGKGDTAKHFDEYGTDFNLVLAWASKLISSGRDEVMAMLRDKKYILVDEYQDFSQLFLSVVQAIREIRPEIKLFVVGDDWQAINRFAGSDVEYFRGFEKVFPEDAVRLSITTNYRCDREIVEMARKFMKKAMREKGDFRAFSKKEGRVMVVNPAGVEVRTALTDYDTRARAEDMMYQKVAKRILGMPAKPATVRYIKLLAQLILDNAMTKSILILHRNNETNIEGARLDRLNDGLREIVVRSGAMAVEEYDDKVRMMTMHKSKGLEAEVVIILEADAGVIPKLHPDTQLYALFGENDEASLDDQKRLFYVAMTRAKKRLYIIHSKASDEGFMKFLPKNTEKWVDF